jgi:hypothetical protein
MNLTYIQPRRNPRKILILLYSIVLLMLVALGACSSSEVEPDTDTTLSTQTSLAQSTASSSSSLTDGTAPLLTATSTAFLPSPTAEGQIATNVPLPSPPIPLPGWEWYQNETLFYSIMYPHSWVVRSGYREGQTIFSSPETNSEVRVDTWEAPTNQSWLDWIKQDPARFALILSSESIIPNAMVLGQPAFFYFQPSAGGGGGDTATLIFQDGNLVFSLLYHSGTMPAYKAEATIYKQMITSFSRATYATDLPVLPAGWEAGSGLVVWREQVEVMNVNETNQQEISGILESLDPGIAILTSDDGQSHTLSGGGYYFDGNNLDMSLMSTNRFIAEGDRLFVVAQLLASGKLKSQYLALEQNGERQPSAYQSFFDLTREQIPFPLLERYLPQEPLQIWLRGTPSQVLPYLMTGENQPFMLEESAVAAKPEVLAFGTLQNLAVPQISVEKFYVLEQPCLIEAIKEVCFPWQQIYPLVSPTVVTATVSSVLPESNTIILEQPSQGFITFVLTSEGQLVKEGEQPANWRDLVPGTNIQAYGEIGTGGVLLTQKVYVLDK